MKNLFVTKSRELSSDLTTGHASRPHRPLLFFVSSPVKRWIMLITGLSTAAFNQTRRQHWMTSQGGPSSGHKIVKKITS